MTSLLESIETDEQQKIIFTRAKYFILALLTHPGDQDLLLGKFAVKP